MLNIENQNKKLLRNEILLKKRNMSVANKMMESNNICKNIANISEFLNAQYISVFAPSINEVYIWKLIEKCFINKKIVAFPKVISDGNMSFHSINKISDLDVGFNGILEPRTNSPIIDIRYFDFCIIPSVAIDLELNRMGLGGGYYDRFLSKLDNSVITCVPVFDCQIIDDVPVEEHDQKIKIIASSNFIFSKNT